MSASPMLQEELELQHFEQEAQRLARELEEARERPLRLARERQELENTMPPLERVNDIIRLKRHEQEIATRAATRNLRIVQSRSVLLLFILSVALVALIAWGYRLMNG